MKILNDLKQGGARMPLLFLGHGSPMNAIESNSFTEGFRHLTEGIATPSAILVISAHWETRGCEITVSEKPSTLHDFSGFPEQLYQVQYPVKGDPVLAREIAQMVRSSEVHPNSSRGLDHGVWSVIRPMYPGADVPVVQLSLDYTRSPAEHFELAGELTALRNKGVLIVGSGNLVHNLGEISWRKLSEEYGYEWAQETNEKIKQFIQEDDHLSLIHYESLGSAFRRSVPTPEHFIPLLYLLALKNEDDPVEFFNDQLIGGSLSMTSVKIG